MIHQYILETEYYTTNINLTSKTTMKKTESTTKISTTKLTTILSTTSAATRKLTKITVEPGTHVV